MGTRSHKVWSKEEIELLGELWGENKPSLIAKKLNRTAAAVKIMAYRQQLDPYQVARGIVPLSKICEALGYDNKNPYRTWPDLPFKDEYVGQMLIHNVDISKFWKWAEKNKHRIDFSKYEPGTLPPDPKWIKEEIKINKRTAKVWTAEEDALLKSMVSLKIPYPKIAKSLNRGYASIGHRVSRLAKQGTLSLTKIGIRWTAEELDMLASMRADGRTVKDIAYELGREHSHVADKIRNLKIKGVLV